MRTSGPREPGRQPQFSALRATLKWWLQEAWVLRPLALLWVQRHHDRSEVRLWAAGGGLGLGSGPPGKRILVAEPQEGLGD